MKNAKIGRAIMDADVFSYPESFKGMKRQASAVLVKNIGMGCGSRAGKMEQHAQANRRSMRICAVAANDA